MLTLRRRKCNESRANRPQLLGGEAGNAPGSPLFDFQARFLCILTIMLPNCQLSVELVHASNWKEKQTKRNSVCVSESVVGKLGGEMVFPGCSLLSAPGKSLL